MLLLFLDLGINFIRTNDYIIRSEAKKTQIDQEEHNLERKKNSND